MNIASLKATVGINDQQFQRGIGRVNQRLDETERNAGRTGDAFDRMSHRLDAVGRAGATLSMGLTAPITAAFGAAIKLASDSEEAISKTGVVFGQHAERLKAWAQTSAQSFGQSRLQALAAASDFGNLFNSMGLSQAAAADMSMQMVQLATDISSLNNISTADALEKLRAGLVGEAEPLRTVGVLLSEDAVKAKALQMGLGSLTDELTEAAKVQARYALIFEQTRTAQGDFARTAQEVANSFRTIQAEVGDLASEFGKELLPVVKDVLRVGRDLLKLANQMTPEQRQFAIKALAGAALLGPALSAFGNAAGAMAMLRGAGGAAGVGGGLSLGPVAGPIAVGVGLRMAGEQLPDPLRRFARSPLENLIGFPKAVRALLEGKSVNEAWKAGDWTWANLFTGKPAAAQAKPASTASLPDPSKLLPRAPARFGNKDLAAISEAQMEAQLAQVRAGLLTVSEDFRSQAEAARVVPILQKRRKDLEKRAAGLKGQIEESADAAKMYWGLQREIAGLQEDETQLQQAAAAEKKERLARLAEQTQRLRQAQFELQQAQVQTSLAAAPVEARSRLEAQRMLPILAARQAELARAADALRGAARNGGEAAAKYYEAATQSTQMLGQMEQLKQAAAREQAEGLRRATEEAARTAAARWDYRMEAGRASAASSVEGFAARTLAETMRPLMQERLASLAAGLSQFVAGTEEWWKQQTEMVRLRAEMGELERSASRELSEMNRRALDDTKRAFQEQAQNASLAVQLQDLQLRNLGVGERIRKVLSLDGLRAQYGMLMRAVQGETENERLQRLIQAETLKGEILDASGVGAKEGRVWGGGTLDFGDTRGRMAELARLDEIAAQAKAGRFERVMVEVNAGATSEEIARAVELQLAALERRSNPGPTRRR